MAELENKEIFSKNLRYYMNINNKDRNNICKDLKFKYTTINDWYNGKTYPRIDKIEMLANYFGIEKSDLIEDKSIKKESKTFEVYKDKQITIKLETLDGNEPSPEQIQEAMDQLYEIKKGLKKD